MSRKSGDYLKIGELNPMIINLVYRNVVLSKKYLIKILYFVRT